MESCLTLLDGRHVLVKEAIHGACMAPMRLCA